MLGNDSQEQLNQYNAAAIQVLRIKYEELTEKFEQVIKLVERTEKDFNANASLDDDQNVESNILTDIFYSWKEIYDKKN